MAAEQVPLFFPDFCQQVNYVFRAYTNWMKNFSPDFYYEHTLHIVNTLKLSPVVPFYERDIRYPVFSRRRK